MLQHDSRRAVPLTSALRGSDETSGGGVAVPRSPLAPADDPYFREIASFANSVRAGAPLFVTPEEAHAAVAVASAARESLRTGRAVPVTTH
jgi:myo-inositol 2-dehydrogenase/D-chiro-inositol 1-dehydrogenase